MNPKLSLLIATYNRPRPLETLLASLETELARVRAEVEILVGDNGSEQATVDVIGSFRSRIPLSVRRWDENRGAHLNHYDLFQRARGELFSWLSDDCVLIPGGLRRLLEVEAAHPECVAYISTEATRQDDKVVLKGISTWDQVLLPSKDAARVVADCLYWYGGKFYRRNHAQFSFADACFREKNSGSTATYVQNALQRHPVHFSADPYFMLNNLSDWSQLGDTLDEQYYKVAAEFFSTLEAAFHDNPNPDLLAAWAEEERRKEHFLFYVGWIAKDPRLEGFDARRLEFLFGFLKREARDRKIGVPDALLDSLLSQVAAAIAG